jgi:hypothetical protein
MKPGLPDDLSEEVKRSITAGEMFRGSRDFFLAYELLGAFRRSPDEREGRAPSPIQAHATCAALALELALKSRIVLDSGEPPSKGPDGHKYVAMFNLLKRPAQEDIASFLLLDGKPATVDGLLAVLNEFEGTFKNWRYSTSTGSSRSTRGTWSRSSAPCTTPSCGCALTSGRGRA